MTRTRAIFSALVLGVGLVTGAPAPAQVMPTQGIDLPWFQSSQERAQRDACRRNLPECRAAVRAQMEFEEAVTVILPWAALGIAILIGLFWLRAQEKKRERRKKLARMHHTPGAFKKLEAEKQAKAEDDDEEFNRMSP
ncbi:MAG: hypothetical protein AB7E79_06400 [Rhodospirillaceae bacterium]